MAERFHHHTRVVSSIVELVRSRGAAGALDLLRAERPAVTPDGYHDTVAVFLVWAVDRLLGAGLTPVAVLWHPLVHEDSPRAWWDGATLDSTSARDGFVSPTLTAPGDPVPTQPQQPLVAA